MYAPALLRERDRRVEVLAHARDAIANDCILAFHQPKIEIASGRVSGFEALLRWHQPPRGLQLPGTIASAFDDSEVGCPIGDRMRHCLLDDKRRWTGDGVPFGRIGLDVLEPEFQRGDLGAAIGSGR